MKKLSEIIACVSNSISATDVEINGLCLDSRLVKKGDLFFAFHGCQVDGKQFIDQAIAAGAVAVVSDQAVECRVPSIVIEDLPQKLGKIADAFYDHPSKKITVIGVTGTNGKSSVCYLLAQALTNMNQRVGLISTIGYGLFDHLSDAKRTTPDALLVQQQLAKFVEQKLQFAVLEVSSHALTQGRVNAVNFDYAIFTNLSRDHLDYHQTMADYAEVKKRLFQWPSIKTAILNIDDDVGRQWTSVIEAPLVTYSAGGQSLADIYAAEVTHHISGMDISMMSPWGRVTFSSQLIGKMNVDNLLAVLSTLCILGFSFSDSLQVIEHLEAVPGRMQLFTQANQAKVVVDYSHSPDALSLALQSLKPYARRLFCVFGCGGDRDKGKRPLMAQAAEQYADYAILTNDNCRSEDPQQIINDIRSGLSANAAFSIELQREQAIAQALSLAQAQDIILVAGKGHESYENNAAASDAKTVKKLLNITGKNNKTGLQ
jgi:UDP-N-acetylmuramoyl-L-alanyl-D-glutamate--2,6-diaminopimelate ligase